MSEQNNDGVAIPDEAQRLRELLRRTQTYVCSNRELAGAAELCGEIAEAMAATKHLRTAGVPTVQAPSTIYSGSLLDELAHRDAAGVGVPHGGNDGR